jgi:hypothetical protein
MFLIARHSYETLAVLHAPIECCRNFY